MIYFVPNSELGLTFANTLRDGQIGKKCGALLVREDCDGGNKELLEKILIEDEFDGSVPVSQQPWKPNSIVILVGKAKSRLAEFEKLCPGFEKHFGPATTIPL